MKILRLSLFKERLNLAKEL